MQCHSTFRYISLMSVWMVILSGCQDSPPTVAQDVQMADAMEEDTVEDLSAPEPLPANIDECGAICADAPLYVLSRIKFSAVADDGTSYGFDLDNADTMCDVQDLQTSDGRGGIDNRLGELLAVLPPAAVDVLPGIVQTSIDSGQLSVLIEAPEGEISRILEAHPRVKALFDNRWLHLLALKNGRIARRYHPGGAWEEERTTERAA